MVRRPLYLDFRFLGNKEPLAPVAAIYARRYSETVGPTRCACGVCVSGVPYGQVLKNFAGNHVGPENGNGRKSGS